MVGASSSNGLVADVVEGDGGGGGVPPELDMEPSVVRGHRWII